MTVYADDIIGDAIITLNDDGFGKWDEVDLFSHVSEGQQVTVLVKPDAYVLNSAVKLEAGVLQTVSGIQLIRIPYNMGTDGATIGAPIEIVDMDKFSRMNPSWTTETVAATVEKVMFDPDDPTKFYVFPPQPASNQGYVQQVRGACPDSLEALGEDPYYHVPIVLGDQYRPVLVNYVIFKAYDKDAAVTQYAAQRSIHHFNLFVNALGRQDLLKKEYSPNKKNEARK